MERMRIGMLALAVVLAAGLAQAQDKKKPDAAPAGPYGLPLLTAVQEKVKLTKEQDPKVKELYDAATKSEEETKKRARENQTDRKDLEKYLAEGKSETITKVKAVLDDTQKKAFDLLLNPAGDAAKKKKNN